MESSNTVTPVNLMTSSGQIVYRKVDGQVVWYGFQFEPSDKFKEFMRQDVRSRLELDEVNRELEAHAQEQTALKFGKGSSEIPRFNVPLETRSWVIGEVIAEAYLQNNYKIEWPWTQDMIFEYQTQASPGQTLLDLLRKRTEQNSYLER